MGNKIGRKSSSSESLMGQWTIVNYVNFLDSNGEKASELAILIGAKLRD